MNQDNFEEKSDEELVKLTLQNQDTFLYLMRRYQGKMISYINKISSVGKEEAEDILQEAYLQIYQNLNNFDPNLKFSSWIYRIVRNKTIDHFRRQRSRPKIYQNLDQDFLLNIQDDLDLDKDLDKQYLRASITKALKELDKNYREVLILKYWEDKDYREIADILKKPSGTIATWLRRAKKQFRQKIKQGNINLQ